MNEHGCIIGETTERECEDGSIQKGECNSNCEWVWEDCSCEPGEYEVKEFVDGYKEHTCNQFKKWGAWNPCVSQSADDYSCMVGYSEYAILTYDHAYNDRVNFLDALAENKVNLTRVWIQGYSNDTGGLCEEKEWFETLPFAFTKVDGKNRIYNLDEYNEVFFSRLRDFIARASERGIWVELTLFDSYGIKKIGTDNDWEYNPWNTVYNEQGYISGNNLKANLRYFFDTTKEIWKVQEKLIIKVIDETKEFKNVLYEIMNEPYVYFDPDINTSDMDRMVKEWHEKVIDLIKDKHPDALIVVNDNAVPEDREDKECGSKFNRGPLMDQFTYDFLSPHFQSWAEKTTEPLKDDKLPRGIICIDKMLNFLDTLGGNPIIIVDDDGCDAKCEEKVVIDGKEVTVKKKIRIFSENVGDWASMAVCKGASFNHLQEWGYGMTCSKFEYPNSMLNAIGSARNICQEN